MFGLADEAVDETVSPSPLTHYGVFKQANEGNARVYFADHGVSSVGLRPYSVYGVGRDAGLTSDPTRAIKSAVVGRPFRIRFSGVTDFIYTADTAAAFIACADAAPDGAHVFNLHGDARNVARRRGHRGRRDRAGGARADLDRRPGDSDAALARRHGAAG